MDRAAGVRSQRHAGAGDTERNRIAAKILEASRRRVAKHLSDEDFREANRALKSTTEQIAREYHGRVVLELVQNAHDALTADKTDGQILIRLEPGEGEYGTLHVANSGLPFTESNLEAIRKVALSDKPPHQAIGNKGIGFKSVLEVTDSPVIYSVGSLGSSEFDGYCFKFPTSNDLSVLVDDLASQKQIANEMLLLGLPVPVGPAPDGIAELAGEGYVTVVSLPLRSQAAYEEIAGQLETLVNPEAPVLLFLTRVSELRVEPDRQSAIVLTRKVKALKGLPHAELVDLGQLGQFLVAQRSVPARHLQAALKSSIDDRLMDAKWGDWEGEVEVAAAVRTDGTAIDGRRYTYLPMARDARSPASVHLNAPFYANISRTEAREDVPFNDLLMDELCRCCIDTANSLSERHEVWVAKAAADLLAWDPEYSARWLAAAEAVGVRPRKSKLLPCLDSSGRGWSTFGEARQWIDLSDDRRRIITGKSVAKVGATILRPELGSERLARIAKLGEAIGYGLKPSQEEIGCWIEALAEQLAAGTFSARKWESFYDDLYELSLESEALSLLGRRILMSDSGELRATSIHVKGRRRRPKVTFFSPVDEEDQAPIDVPRSLRAGFAFMHRDIDWNLHDGVRRKRPGRKYLEDSGLVSEYRSASVLSALRQILEGSEARTVHRDAARLAFQLFSSESSIRQEGFRDLPLRVENAAGKLIEAKRALFSPGWGTKSGQLLSDLVDHASSQSPEIAALKDRMLGDPSSGQSPAADWHAFWEMVGVTDGLPLESLALRSNTVVGNIASNRRYLGHRIDLSEVDSERWHEDGPEVRFAPQTYYRFREPPLVIAGQRDHDQLDDHGKELFARLLLRRLDLLPATALEVTLVKVNNPRQEPQRIPTPFHAFLTLARWLPTGIPGQGEGTVFKPLSQTWQYQGRMQRPLPFARLMSPEVAQELQNESVFNKLKQLGLLIWDDPQYSSHLVSELADLVTAGVGQVHEKFIQNEYALAWHHVVKRNLPNPFQTDPGAGVVVVRNGRLRVRVPDREDEPVLVPCGDAAAVDPMQLEDVDVVPTAPDDGPAISEILASHVDQVIRTDQLNPSIDLDGDPPGRNNTIPLLADERSWLPVFFLAAQRFARSRHQLRPDAATHEALGSLRAVRVGFCSEARIHLEFVGDPIPITPTHPVLVDDRQLIVSTGHSSGLDSPWTWNTIDALSRPIAQLLEEPELFWRLKTAIGQIQKTLGANPDDVVDADVEDSVMASALEIGISEIKEIKDSLRVVIIPTLERLYPLLRVAFGPSPGGPFNPDDTQICDREQLLDALTTLLTTHLPTSSTWHQTPKDLLELVENPMPWHEIASHLGINFSDLNSELIELGPPYLPDFNSDGQQALFEEFIEGNREAIAARLREAHLASFKAKGSLADYTAARRLLIEADPAWVKNCWLQDETMMRERITNWISEQSADPDLSRPSDLAPLLTLQKGNRLILLDIAKD